MTQNTQTPFSNWNNYIREEAKEVSIINAYRTNDIKNSMYDSTFYHVLFAICVTVVYF